VAATGAGADALGVATGAQLIAAIEHKVSASMGATERCAERVARGLRESIEFVMACGGGKT
jgi:hypothetical protein